MSRFFENIRKYKFHLIRYFLYFRRDGYASLRDGVAVSSCEHRCVIRTFYINLDKNLVGILF